MTWGDHALTVLQWMKPRVNNPTASTTGQDTGTADVTARQRHSRSTLTAPIADKPLHSRAALGEKVQSRPIRILRLRQVLDVTGLGKTKVYDLQARGSFPMRVKITDHSVGWIEEEVQAWLTKRIALSASRRPAGRPLCKHGP